MITALAQDGQIDEILKPIVEGKRLNALAMSEPGSGNRLWHMDSFAQKDGDDHYIIDSFKSFSTSTGHCDFYVVPLRANGASVAKCIWYSILTSLPQPVVAVPAFLLVSVFQPLLPASLGFAGGAMIFLVVQELLPESFEYSSATEAAWGVTIGLVGMLGFIAAIGL